jgi:CheY-like chemotaxis protein
MSTNASELLERVRRLEDEKKRLIEALRRTEEELRQARKTEVLGRLTGAIAHDFNNLLTAVCGFGGILVRRMRSDDPLLEDAREIHKAGERATSLTRQLLSFSRRRAAQPAELDLNALVAEAEKMMRRLVGETISLVVETAPELGLVWADAGQIEQALINLVVNARDAMPEGGTLTIETANADSGDGSPCVRLTVRDTGEGIAPEALDRLFEPFFSTKGEQGTGLGLATVQAIAKDWGGFVQVASEPGQGAAFEVWLPRSEARAKRRGKSGAAPEAQLLLPRGGSGETVLVVEDDELVRELACRVLEANGYAAIEARHPDEALSVCSSRREPIHALVTDVVLPRMSGLELSERVRKRFPDAKLLFMSGYGGDHPDVERAVSSGTAFMQKPFSGEVLLAKLRDLLDGARP